MTAANATVHDYGHTVSIQLDSTVRRFVHLSPEEAVAVYAALHAWVSGDKEEK